MNRGGNVIGGGAKPEGLILTRPPLVLVHGINSDPSVWDDPSGGTSFANAMKGYPTTFRVDHRGADPTDPTRTPTHGEGEISHMYVLVEQTIGTATATYRSGKYFSANPYAAPNAAGAAPSGALIAVQKTDAVAHSYGGLLTRWYVEQSGDFPGRRDVRKAIELDTPNLGSPLANMVAEARTNDPLGDLIAASHAYGVGPGVPQIQALLNALNKPGALVNSPPGGGVYPFFADAGVDSARLQQLNANPFNDDVGYASVVGDLSTIAYTINTNWFSVTTPHFLNLFAAFQPMWYAATIGTPLISAPLSRGRGYFPWIYTFDGAAGLTDGVVPTWSQSLGITQYSPTFTVDHVDVVQNPAVQQQVLQWLNDPNVLLGSAQRSAWIAKGGNQPPVSDRNAYAPSVIGANGLSTGGGLNPNAVVKLQFPGTSFAATTWDSDPADVGIKLPTMTGMIRVGDIGKTSFNVISEDNDFIGPGSPSRTILDTAPSPSQAALNIDPSQLAGAGPNDWVAFSFMAGRTGRRHKPLLTGPLGTSARNSIGIGYEMADLPDGWSPPVPINLPDFVLPQPAHTGLSVIMSGAVESTDSSMPSQSVWVQLRDDSNGTNVAETFLSVPHTGLGATPWDGVLLPYTGAIQLQVDSSGFVYGNDGNTGDPHPQIYQYLHERWGVSNAQSIAVGI